MNKFRYRIIWSYPALINYAESLGWPESFFSSYIEFPDKNSSYPNCTHYLVPVK